MFKLFVKMSTETKVAKSTLARKLAKQCKVLKPNTPLIKKEANDNVQDIEDVLGDTAGAVSRRYFSPIQTRKQRQKLSAHKVMKGTSQEPLSTTLASSLAGTKTTIMRIGSATVVKCPVVPQHSTKIEPFAEVITKKDSYKLDWTPNDLWQQQLENIRVMRSSNPAPVDTMGCHQCADTNADEKTQRFHKLVALMLSSQTKDETTYEAMKRLKARTLTPTSILAISVSDLEQLLCPVSFYKNKAKYLKQTAQLLIDKYDSDIPNNVKELIALPGVGPKMAHICMATAWNQITGIGVDVHVHRISNRLAWLKKPTKEPEQTRVGLESWLPRELWAEVNHLFVGFGQTICTPVKPNCAKCLNVHICPAAKKL